MQTMHTCNLTLTINHIWLQIYTTYETLLCNKLVLLEVIHQKIRTKTNICSIRLRWPYFPATVFVLPQIGVQSCTSSIRTQCTTCLSGCHLSLQVNISPPHHDGIIVSQHIWCVRRNLEIVKLVVWKPVCLANNDKCRTKSVRKNSIYK